MRKKLILGVFLVAAPLSAANAMDVATFLNKADVLEKKGMGALFSSDFKLLKGEVERASAALRAERLVAEKAGRKGAYCPTKKSGLSTRELLASFRTIPVARRPNIQVKDALRAVLARKYPCPR